MLKFIYRIKKIFLKKKYNNPESREDLQYVYLK